MSSWIKTKKDVLTTDMMMSEENVDVNTFIDMQNRTYHGTPQEFLIRFLDLKQKILFASQENDSEPKYDPTLVHGMFVHSFSLGLQNENFKIEMKLYQEKKIMSDEELFEKLNVCVSNEMERSQKFGSPLTTKVNAVQEGRDKQATKNSEVEQALMKELRELKVEVAVVKERVRTPSQAEIPPHNRL